MVNGQLPSTANRVLATIGLSTQGNLRSSGFRIVAPLEFAQTLGK
jgi:hypothetical protein